jgi:predicted nucleotidyltransferase
MTALSVRFYPLAFDIGNIASYQRETTHRRCRVVDRSASGPNVAKEFWSKFLTFGYTNIRFPLFGSTARGQMRFDSDVDIVVEFPSDR